MTPQQFANKMRHLPTKAEKWVIDAIKDNIPEMQDWNVEQMEKRGVTSEGLRITNQAGDHRYSEEYEAYKSARGGETRFINLHLEGDFHSALEVKVDSKGNVDFYIDEVKADDGAEGKTKTLLKWYGNEILGLTQYNIENLMENIVWHLINELTTYFSQ